MTSLNLVSVTATSSGLTTSTTAYTDGDVMGAEMSWNLGSALGLISGAVLTDVADVVGAVDLFLFDRSVSFGTDNAGPSISDADALFSIGVIQFPYPYDQGGNRVASIDSIALPWTANASTTIYGRMVTRSGHTFFGAATNIQVRLFGSKDA